MMEILFYPVFLFMAIHERVKRQPLIKQSIKLYVVIKCHQPTEHHVQKNRAEGLSSFHIHWSFLVQNEYATVFLLYSRLLLGYDFSLWQGCTTLVTSSNLPYCSPTNIVGKLCVSDTRKAENQKIQQR